MADTSTRSLEDYAGGIVFALVCLAAAGGAVWVQMHGPLWAIPGAAEYADTTQPTQGQAMIVVSVAVAMFVRIVLMFR